MPLANLYWIDDSSKHMLPIVDNVFPLLWDEDFSCTSILFGNAYCVKADEHGPDQEDCKELSNYIEAKFILYCQDLDRHYWREAGETFKEKQHLLFRPAAKIIPLEHTLEGDTENVLRLLANQWMDQDNLTAFQEASATMPLEEALDEYGLSVDTLCFSDKGDCLSQWRGYCFNGGAAIEFDIGFPRLYSVLHADNETSYKYELVHNTPFPVIYVDRELLSRSKTTLSDQILSDSAEKKYDPWEAKDIIPYLKDRAFAEESEWRLMFSNHRGELSKCVRFRTLQDGVKVPYMIIKAGDLGKNLSGCAFDVSKFSDAELRFLREKGIYCITIPQGNNQESVYYKLEDLVNKHNLSQKGRMPIRIYCEGHLPIKRIIVAPTYDRERVAEKIKRYCWSNYWLRNVEVTYSSIPYIPPSE